MLPDVNTTDLARAVNGGQVQLNCTAQGGGAMNQFQWFDSDGSLVSSSGRITITMVDNGMSTLTIDPVEPEDQGMYTCVVTTGVVIVNSTILLEGMFRIEEEPLSTNTHNQFSFLTRIFHEYTF